MNDDVFRINYKNLTENQKEEVRKLKEKAKELFNLLQKDMMDGRYTSSQMDEARNKLHECVFWAVHAITETE